MARFYWLGICGYVRRWCTACHEYQLLNLPATSKALLHPLQLIKVPFGRTGMDLVRPLDRTARGHCFVLVLVDYAKQYTIAAISPHIISPHVMLWRHSSALSPESGSRKTAWVIKARLSYHKYYVSFTNYWGLNRFAPAFIICKRMGWSNDLIRRTFVHDNVRNWD